MYSQFVMVHGNSSGSSLMVAVPGGAALSVRLDGANTIWHRDGQSCTRLPGCGQGLASARRFARPSHRDRGSAVVTTDISRPVTTPKPMSARSKCRSVVTTPEPRHMDFARRDVHTLSRRPSLDREGRSEPPASKRSSFDPGRRSIVSPRSARLCLRSSTATPSVATDRLRPFGSDVPSCRF